MIHCQLLDLLMHAMDEAEAPTTCKPASQLLPPPPPPANHQPSACNKTSPLQGCTRSTACASLPLHSPHRNISPAQISGGPDVPCIYIKGFRPSLTEGLFYEQLLLIGLGIKILIINRIHHRVCKPAMQETRYWDAHTLSVLKGCHQLPKGSASMPDTRRVATVCLPWLWCARSAFLEVLQAG